jgi:hypothetical protein
MILTICLLVLLLTVSIGLNIYLGKKALNAINQMEVYYSTIIDIKQSMSNTYRHLKEIDHLNIFEKDDDVGFVFSEIVRTIEMLNTQYETENKTEKPD